MKYQAESNGSPAQALQMSFDNTDMLNILTCYSPTTEEWLEEGF